MKKKSLFKNMIRIMFLEMFIFIIIVKKRWHYEENLSTRPYETM